MNSSKLDVAVLSGRFLRGFLVVAIVALAALQAGRAESLSAEEAQLVEARLKVLSAAFRSGKFDEVVDMMHPSAFAGTSKEHMQAMTKEAAAKMKEINLAYLDEQFGTPGEVYSAGDELVFFYPRTMTVQIGAKKVKQTGFVTCVKKSTGGEWLFISDATCANPAKLAELFPELPKDVKLPEMKVEALE